jgi:hypothetical protein
MAFVADTLLIIRKIFVTILIYAVPVAIIVGGLVLTKHLLIDSATKTEVLSPVSKIKP